MKGYLCSMQLDEEMAECLIRIFYLSSTSKYLKLNLNFQNQFLFFTKIE